MPPDARDQADMAAARAAWEEIAARARAIHCPEHFVAPWRVTVTGDTPETLRLRISGCCQRLQVAATELINADPRISGPR